MAVEKIAKKHEDLRNLVWQYLFANGLSVRKLSQNINLPYYSLYRFLHGKTHKYPRKYTLHALEDLVKGGNGEYSPPQEYKDNKALTANKNYDSKVIFELFQIMNEIIKTNGLNFQSCNQAWEIIRIFCDFHTQTGRKDIDKEFLEFMLRRKL